MSKKLIDYIVESKNAGKALGHFNFGSLEMLYGIIEAGKELNCPIIVGLSEGERNFLNGKRMADLVKNIREQENYPIFLNADHTHTIENAKKAIDDGFDSIVADGSKLSFEENIKFVKEVKDYAKKVGSEILIEGELGFIGDSSKIIDSLPDNFKENDDYMTKIDDAVEFVKQTGVDLFSPSVGTVHGMFKGGNDPQVSIKRVEEISNSVSCPLVLHGGSGTKDDVLAEAVKSGIAVVHISTELRVAFKDGLIVGLGRDENEITPSKYMTDSITLVKDLVFKKLKIFGWGL